MPQKTMARYFDVTHATAQLEPTFISKVNTAVQLAAIAVSLGAPIWGYVGKWLLFMITDRVIMICSHRSCWPAWPVVRHWSHNSSRCPQLHHQQGHVQDHRSDAHDDETLNTLNTP